MSHVRPEPFEAVLERQRKRVLLRASGVFDEHAKKRFQECLEAIPAIGVSHVLLDLRKVTFIDSSGLRLVLELWSRARREGFDFAALAGQDQVGRALRTTGLDKSFPVLTEVPPEPGDPGAEARQDPATGRAGAR